MTQPPRDKTNTDDPIMQTGPNHRGGLAILGSTSSAMDELGQASRECLGQNHTLAQHKDIALPANHGVLGGATSEPAEVAPMDTAYIDLDRAAESGRRLRIALEAREMHNGGKTWRQIGAALGVPWSNLPRWVNALDQRGNVDDQFHNCGRKSDFEKIAKNESVRQRLQQLYLMTIGASAPVMTKGRRTGRAALALERFAEDSSLCPPHLAEALRAGSQPAPLLRVIREITPAVEARLRGAKHTSLDASLIHRRNGIEVLADGTERKIELGDYWVFDDMSSNHYFYFLGPDGKPEIGRQGLYCYDKTGRWVGFELVGTGRDSYTAAIILRFLRQLIETHGLPKRGIVFEQSVWHSNIIRGIEPSSVGRVVNEEWQQTFEPLPGTELHLIQDGIEALGIKLIYVYSPRGKEIEGAFNYFQAVYDTLAPLNSVKAGRHAGEFEDGARKVRQAKAGVKHPSELGFLHIDQHADLTDQTMAWINLRSARRAAAIAARQTGKDARQAVTLANVSPYPAGRALREQDYAVFLPHKTEVKILGGRISCDVDTVTYDFSHPEQFAILGDGYRVIAKFDPAEPSLGAWIYNNETSSINHAGYAPGQLICHAPFAERVNSFDWRLNDQRDNAGHESSRAYARSVRSVYRATGMPDAKLSAARDGKGQVITVGPPSTPISPAAPQPQAPRVTSAPIAPIAQEPIKPRGGFRLRQLEDVKV